MNAIEMNSRLKKFAVGIILLVRKFSKSDESKIIGRQIIRSATSIGANYRSSIRGRSQAEFISKIKIAEEEADETCWWLELIIELKLAGPVKLDGYMKEANELVAILTASGKTASKNLKNKAR